MMELKEEFFFVLLAASEDKELLLRDAIEQFNNFFNVNYRNNWDDSVQFWNMIREYEYDNKIFINNFSRNPSIIFKDKE